MMTGDVPFGPAVQLHGGSTLVREKLTTKKTNQNDQSYVISASSLTILQECKHNDTSEVTTSRKKKSGRKKKREKKKLAVLSRWLPSFQIQEYESRQTPSNKIETQVH
jgi:hypothetical protein